MKFYKVKNEKNYWKNGKYCGVAIENELITEKEMQKRGFPFSDNFKPVEVKRTNTYWCFGCRFEM